MTKNPKAKPPLLRVEDTLWQRRQEYGECTAALVMNPETGGAEGLFNQALTNGLAAIVNHQWPGEERKANGRVKSASELLALINRRVRRRGNMRVLQGQIHGRRWRTAIATEVLLEGVKMTDPIRHGTTGSPAEKRHIDALVKLDNHPSLRSTHESLRDEGWVQMVAADREARVRAYAYMTKLSEEEWARRQHPDFVENDLPFSPKERASSHGADTCPVCDLETFIVEEIDSFGLGIGAGTCRACGYTRTPEMAEDEAIDAKIEYELGKDD